jgi:hypothetical protein
MKTRILIKYSGLLFNVPGVYFRKMGKYTQWLVYFVAAAIYGTLVEWALGAIWDTFGECPYIYPNSSMTYSSLIMLPVWGLAGLHAIVIFLAIRNRKPKTLLWLILLAALTVALVAMISLI